MGLLGDGFDDPRSGAVMALAGGLLQGNFGAGIVGANDAYRQAKQDAAKQQFMKMQMDNYASEIKQRDEAIKQKQQLQAITQRLLSGGSVPARQGQLGSGSFGIMPTAPGVPDMPAPRPAGLGGASLDDIVALHAAGGPDLLNAYKLAREGFERKPGTFYEGVNGGREYIPDPVKGVNFQGGRITPIPGFMDFTTQQTLATEAPKTLLNAAGTVNLRKNPDGTESPVSALSENPTLQNVLGGIFGGNPGQSTPPNLAQPRPMPPQAVPQSRPVVSPAAQRGADAESIRMMQAELQNPNLSAADRAGITRELQRLQATQSTPGFPTPTLTRLGPYGKTTAQETADAATREKAVTEAKIPAQATGQVNETWLKTSYEPTVNAGNAATEMLTNVQSARTAMRNMGGTGWGTEAKAVGASVLAGMGIAPQTAKLYAANAETFQNAAMSNLQTVLNAAKGPQTEGDAARASKTFAQLKNTPQANEFILDLAEARAQRDAMKARFFQEALPIARQKGDLQEVEREWLKRAPSVFSLPPMQRWLGGIK